MSNAQDKSKESKKSEETKNQQQQSRKEEVIPPNQIPPIPPGTYARFDGGEYDDQGDRVNS